MTRMPVATAGHAQNPDARAVERPRGEAERQRRQQRHKNEMEGFE